ncbi:Syntaxin-binding protein 4-like isoform X3 [Oopsacas minuta]|uniref:Syntaxin-binding protein 4-like isoform X3 n=1 Tax=Oopsacas minuta TaxID=111878 RepID=A0AAV7JDB7_9METZ|nr:Syntaxin-binding protein 4-like isoform X3 [Oopsacas minuta]
MTDNIHIITVNGCKTGLGIRIVGPSIPDSPYGVFIKSVTEGSLADTDGQLRTGDKLVRVGEIELTGKTQRQAIDVLKLEAQTDSMTFTIDRSEQAAEEFDILMTQSANEMTSTSTSSIVGGAVSLTGGEDTEERWDPETLTEESLSVSEQAPSSAIQTITIEKTTHLGIVVQGKLLTS